MHAIRHILLLFVFLFFVSACGSQTENSSSPQSIKDSSEIQDFDQDNDGIPDTQDNWPEDPSLPKISSLWGINGEKWTTTSRMPFVALAGYDEGRTEPANITRIVANVIDFGASPQASSTNDTQAFLDAITFARTQVSAANPGVIYVPEGVYDINEQLHLNVSGMVLRGTGENKTILRFNQGLINSTTALGTDPRRRKLIVMGGNYDENYHLQSGVNWQQWNSDYSAALDTNNLPKRGDMRLQLAEPLSETLKQNIINQNFRIRLAQTMQYGENSDTPELASSIYGGPDFSPSGANGGISVSQQFIVTIDADNKTLILDRPLRFTPSAESTNGGARIAVRNNDNSWSTEEIGIENLTITLPETDWIDHYGTEGQGGIEIMSDNSWVRNIHIINADNGIEIDKKTFNNTIEHVTLSATRIPRRSGPAEHRYDAFGHHGITLKGRDHMLKDFTLEVSFVHDVTMNNCHGCVVMRGKAPQLNMDHHRQGIYSSIWTEIQLGKSHRMWDSTGNPSEGYNAAAYNTYWNIDSNTPELDYWPEDGDGEYPQWGYHRINIIGTNIKQIPMTGTGNRPYPYHPDNAHLETFSPDEVWPQNIYDAQHSAYYSGSMLNLN